MSRIENLMNELCPNGVERVKLNEICEIYDGTHQTPDYKNFGVPFISVENIGNIYNSTKYISMEDYNKYKIKPQINDIFMTRIGSIGKCAVFEKDMDLAYYVSLALLRPDNKRVNSHFLKHLIESTTGTKELRKRTLVNAVPIKINKDDIGKIKIPVPPLEVQRKIVRILDIYSEKNTQLTEALYSEIELRKKQYKYYRNMLLNFDNSVEWRTLGDVCEIFTGGEAPKESIREKVSRDDYIYPIYSNGVGNNSIWGFAKTYRINKTAVTFSLIGTIGCPTLRQPYFTPIIRLKVLIPKDDNVLSVKFLKYSLETVEFGHQKSSVPNINANMLKSISIPVPPIEEQERVVKILDRFDSLCNDLTDGLPAEISARQKQYEYYRDKILTFKEEDYENRR